MKRTNTQVLVIIAAAFLSGCEPATTPAERLLEDITYLASDELEGRGVGTKGLELAAEYVAENFAEAGLEAPGGSYLQTFTIDSTAPAAAHAGLGGASVANIVGIRPGTGDLADETVVVGAHYDHLGMGGDGSLQPDLTGTIHNGADDNASGTVALIEIARNLDERSTRASRTIVFVAFTAEELGLIGSAYYVQNPIRSNESTFAMINLDMVGRMEESKVAALGAETAEEFIGLIEDVNDSHQLEVASSGDGFGRSDHQSFFVEDIPVIHFFTGTHVDYHTTTDDTDGINIEGLAQVAAFVSDLTWELATRREALTFVDAEERTVTASTGERPYLGTIPDMTSSPGGVRVSGITPGSPADDAGMASGDILIGIGDHVVADLYDMTNALNAFKPGDAVTLRVRRGQADIELPATLGRRGG